MRQVIVMLCVVGLCAGGATAGSEGQRKKIEASIAKGTKWLRASQQENGAFGKRPDVGITGLVVAALAGTPKACRSAEDQAAIEKGVQYLLKHVRKDGAIVTKDGQLANYRTSIAIMALVAADPKKYGDTIARARDFVTGLQFDERKGFAREKNWQFGGIGYGREEIPDMSNMKFAVEALRDAGVKEDSEVFRRAVVFMARCQNLNSTNDLAKIPGCEKIAVGTDGGLTYRPVDSKAGKVEHADGTYTLRSYGSMTYAGLLTFIYAGVDKKDRRVRAALDWIRKNYTLKENPGLSTGSGSNLGKQGLYYYYHTFAKALAASGEQHITTPDGTKHDWAAELSAKLLSLQRADGSWVNENSRWLEASPALVTSYSLLAQYVCYDELLKR